MSKTSIATPEIRIFADRYEFQGNAYDSAVELVVVLETSPELALAISVSDCAGDDRVAEIMEVLKNRNQANVGYSSFSEGCK